MPPEVAAAHARLLADATIQFSLAPPQPPRVPAWLKPVLQLLSYLGPYLIYLFWAAVIGGALIIVFLIVRDIAGVAWRWPWSRVATTAAADDAAAAPDAGRAQILLAEADALADAGDYDAAVHLLLRRSVEDIVERLPGFLRPSLTARDIAVSSNLPERARGAFATMALVVEAAVFARLPVGVAGWQRARGAYADFAQPAAWTRHAARG